MVREIDGRGLVRRRRVFEAQRIVVGERVANAGRECAGKALFPVRAHVGQRHGGDAGSRRGRGGPHDAAEVFRTAVDVVRFAVRRHLHLASVEGEAGVRDAVGHATEDRAGLGKASGETLLAGGDFADDTAEFSIAVPHAQIREDGAVGHDFGDGAVAVGEREELNVGAFRRATYDRPGHCGDGCGGRGLIGGHKAREPVRGIEREVEQAVGTGDDFAHAAQFSEEHFLMRDAVAVGLEAAELLTAEAGDEQAVSPTGKTVARVKFDARRSDRGRPEGEGRIHVGARGCVLPPSIGTARDNGPAVVVAGVDHVDLVAASRAVLGGPEASGARMKL